MYIVCAQTHTHTLGGGRRRGEEATPSKGGSMEEEERPEAGEEDQSQGEETQGMGGLAPLIQAIDITAQSETGR